jgi:phage terminase large subunit-like protein
MAKRVDDPTREDLFDLTISELSRSIYMPNILSYKPYGAQLPFHQSDSFGRILTAGNRAGKTDAMVVEFIHLASNTDPFKPRPKHWAPGPIQLRIISVDIAKGVEQILLPKFQRWMTPSMLVDGSWEKSWNKNSLILTFSNGSTIDFLTYSMTLDKHAGVPRHAIGFDEEPPRDIFNEGLMRLMDYDGYWIISATPVNGMDWIFDLLVEPSQAGDLPSVKVFELDASQNPHLMAGQDRSKFQIGMDKEERQIRGEGKYIARSGLVFPKFKDNLDKYVLDEAPDILAYVRGGWQIYSTVDHGWNNPTAWYWIAVNRMGDCVVFAEHYASEMTVAEHAQKVLANEASWHVKEENVIRSGDPAMKQTSGITGTSVISTYADCGVYIGVDTIPHDVGIGVEKLQQYLRLGDDGYPKLRISPNCPHLIRELKKLRWATYDSQKTAYSKNKQELIHKKDDHGFDSIRYWATQMPDLTPEVDQLLSRDSKTAETIGFGDLIARMRDNDEIDFVDDHEDDWKITESYGDYYGQDA